jgi:hypothetical protein
MSYRDLAARSPELLTLGFAISRSPKSRHDKGSLKSQRSELIGVSAYHESGVGKVNGLISQVVKSR